MGWLKGLDVCRGTDCLAVWGRREGAGDVFREALIAAVVASCLICSCQEACCRASALALLERTHAAHRTQSCAALRHVV